MFNGLSNNFSAQVQKDLADHGPSKKQKITPKCSSIRHGNKTHTRVGYEFRFSPISKHDCGTGNGYIGTHPKLILKHVTNAENYFMLICNVILFDNCCVISTIDI